MFFHLWVYYVFFWLGGHKSKLHFRVKRNSVPPHQMGKISNDSFIWNSGPFYAPRHLSRTKVIQFDTDYSSIMLFFTDVLSAKYLKSHRIKVLGCEQTWVGGGGAGHRQIWSVVPSAIPIKIWQKFRKKSTPKMLLMWKIYDFHGSPKEL